MLEEHIREIELQSQERLIEEQKRHKELVQRLEVRPCPIIQSLSQFYPDFIQKKILLFLFSKAGHCGFLEH